MILMYIFETYLDVRQHKALKLPTLPKTLEGVISQEKFEKSRAYSLDKRFVSFCSCEFLSLDNDILPSNKNFSDIFFFVILYLLLCLISILTHDFYFHLSSNFHFIHELVTIVTDSTILYFGVLPWFWKVRIWCGVYEVQLLLGHCKIYIYCLQKSGEYVTTVGLNAENEILHTLAFLAGLMIWSQVCFRYFFYC